MQSSIFVAIKQQTHIREKIKDRYLKSFKTYDGMTKEEIIDAEPKNKKDI